MTTTYAWGATGMRQIDDPEKVNVAFVQHEDFARAETEVLILRNDLATYAERIAALEAERELIAPYDERERIAALVAERADLIRWMRLASLSKGDLDAAIAKLEQQT